MIDARELRIGNWLYSKLTKVNFQVNAGDIESINGSPNVVDLIQPTKEWLDRFEFKNNNGLYRKFPLMINAGNHFIIHIEKGNDFFIPVQHNISVHYIQNLYYSLTGKELEIKN